MLTRLAAIATAAWLRLVTGSGARPDAGSGAPADAGDRDRGDVPGWVLVTAMTVALVLAIWAIANEQITNIVRDALERAKFGGDP